MQNDSQTIEEVIAAVTEAVLRAYGIGQRDTLKRVLASAQEGLSVPLLADTRKPRVAPPNQPPLPSMLQTATGRAAHGAVKTLVREFVLNAGRPVTEQELGRLHPEINRSSRYMAFRNLLQEGEIVKQGDTWVPAPQGEGNPGADTPG